MQDRIGKWFPVLFLAVLASLSYWLENKVGLSSLSDAASGGHVPDVVVKNFSATKLGEDGKPRQSLSAKALEHYADDSTKLTEPVLLLVSPGQADMRVSSDWALLSDNGEDVYLHDKVLVSRAAYANHSRMDMTTDYLHLNPDRHAGETKRPVRIKDEKIDIHAVGMAFDDETRVVKLLSSVHVDYEK